jgi:hypothetical protein
MVDNAVVIAPVITTHRDVENDNDEDTQEGPANDGDLGESDDHKCDTRSRRWFAIGAILVLVVIVAVVLAIVLPTTPDPTSTTPKLATDSPTNPTETNFPSGPPTDSPETDFPTDFPSGPPTDSPETDFPSGPPTDSPETDFPTDFPSGPTTGPETDFPSALPRTLRKRIFPPLSCETEIDQVNVCINNELIIGVAMTCKACVENALVSLSGEGSCVQLEDMACRKRSCACGSCIDELETALVCAELYRGCQFDCDDPPTDPPTDPPGTDAPTSARTDPLTTNSDVYTPYAFEWAGNPHQSCRATEPAPIARCGGQGTIKTLDDPALNNSNHDCEISLTGSSVLVCTAQEEGLAYVACVGKEAADRELSVTLPAINTVCDGDFAADEHPGLATQYIFLTTWCGNEWVYNADTCLAELETLDTGEPFCFSRDNCGDSVCTASLPAVTVTSTGQYRAQCTYAGNYSGTISLL